MNSRSITTPDDADDDRRQHQRAPIGNAEIVQQHPRTERAHHVLRAVREVDDVHEPEDHRQPQRQQRIERAVDQAQQQLAEQRLRWYAEQLEHRARASRSSFAVDPGGPIGPPGSDRQACYFTSGQPPSASGRKASSAGMVARTL